MKAKPPIVYKRRGVVERPSRHGMKWHNGYSEDGPEGSVLYPWWTKKECFTDAKSRNSIPSFQEES